MNVPFESEYCVGDEPRGDKKSFYRLDGARSGNEECGGSDDETHTDAATNGRRRETERAGQRVLARRCATCKTTCKPRARVGNKTAKHERSQTFIIISCRDGETFASEYSVRRTGKCFGKRLQRLSAEI
jgi:hypothetical protein